MKKPGSLYQTAVLCSALPLLVGTLVFLLWLATDWDWLMPAGFLVIAGGILSFLVGALSLFIYLRRERRNPDASEAALRRQGRLAGALLLVNFPIAFLYMLVANYLQSACRVQVFNDSRQPVEALRLEAPGDSKVLGAIPPGGSCRASLNARAEGSLALEARWRGRVSTATLDAYVGSGMGDRSEVHFLETGDVETVNDDGRRQRILSVAPP